MGASKKIFDRLVKTQVRRPMLKLGVYTVGVQTLRRRLLFQTVRAWQPFTPIIGPGDLRQW